MKIAYLFQSNRGRRVCKGKGRKSQALNSKLRTTHRCKYKRENISKVNKEMMARWQTATLNETIRLGFFGLTRSRGRG
jgi:hypothetical protein